MPPPTLKRSIAPSGRTKKATKAWWSEARMLLYADEDFPFPAVEELRRLGHDVVTAQEDGRTSVPDPEILARAHGLSRPVLTYNRRHYERLHKQGADHSGILSATQDPDHA